MVGVESLFYYQCIHLDSESLCPYVESYWSKLLLVIIDKKLSVAERPRDAPCRWKFC